MSLIINRILVVACLLATATQAGAQQTGRVTRRFFPDPDITINTPAFQKRHGFTNYKELRKFMTDYAAAHADNSTLSVVGKTQAGRDIMMMHVSTAGKTVKDNGRLRVMYTGCVHGNEPASTEGMLYFMQRLQTEPQLKALLGTIDFYIIPCVNVDGNQHQRRETANGTDLNRDQTMLTSPEARAMQAVAQQVDPQVYVDFHEYKPLRSSYDEVGEGRVITNPHDFMLLWSNNPNVAKSLRDEVTTRFVPAIRAAADKAKLTHHDYYTTKSLLGHAFFNIGGSSPRSTSNIMSLRGSVAMLIEVRGVALGRTSYKRRTQTVALVAETVAKTAARDEADVRHAVNEARADRSPLAVTFTPLKVQGYNLPFIDMTRCKLIEIPVDATLTAQSTPGIVRQRPEAYWLDASCAKAAEVLRQYGVQVEQTTQPRTVRITAYTVTKAGVVGGAVNGISPMGVSTTTATRAIDMPAGSYRVSTRQPLGTLACVLLEPESANGFVNYRILPAQKDSTLGVYRQEETDK